MIHLPEWVPPALIGLAFGLAVSSLNHLILMRGLKKGEGQEPPKSKNIILKRYGIRYILNIAALFLVYKNTPMLIATAIGLTLSKNLLFLRYLSSNTRRKG